MTLTEMWNIYLATGKVPNGSLQDMWDMYQREN